MEKAKISVLDKGGNVEKDLVVMFNPTEFSNSLNAKWVGETSDIQFRKTEFSNLTLELFFDSYEEGHDVREDHNTREGKPVIGTKRISELTIPTVEGKFGKQPPLCLFSWGKFLFKGIIEKVDQKFIMFLPSGIPVRAKITVVMKSVQSVKDALTLNGVGACRKARIVKEGDRLDIIAAEELKDATKWHLIASLNRIADPLNFPARDDMGKVLIIPDMG